MKEGEEGDGKKPGLTGRVGQKAQDKVLGETHTRGDGTSPARRDVQRPRTASQQPRSTLEELGSGVVRSVPSLLWARGSWCARQEAALSFQ